MSTSVTEAEVEALFDKDGDLREEPQEKEAPIEETKEEDASEEAQESKEEPTEGEEAALNWDSLDPRYKSAFEQAVADGKKWQEQHGKIQSNWTKDSKARKELESNLAELKTRDDVLSRWETLLKGNQRLQQIIQSELARTQDPLNAVEVPDELRQNPVFRHVQETYAPYIKSLEQKLQALEQKTGKFDEYEKQVQQQEAQATLDEQLNAAREEIKSFFGRDATEDEVTQVLQYMVEHKFYSNGSAAALAVFKDQFRETVARRQSEEMKEKAKKFPPRNKSVNSNRAAAPSKDAFSPEEAIAMALAEQGVN